MNKKNYILNNTNTRYFDYFFFKKLAGGANPAPTIEGEGTNFTLVTESNMNITQFRSKGDIEQNTYSGKNLFNSYSLTNPSSGTIAISEDGTVSLSGNTGSNGYCRFVSLPFKNIAPNLTAGNTYYLSLTGENIMRTYIYMYGSNSNWENGTMHTITQGELNNDIVLYGGYQATTKFKIMITTAADSNYEPYVGGIPSPNPDYPQDINVVTGTQTVTITNGTSTQSYAITLGSLELCKIGTCQDYIYKDGDDWYVHKAIGKISSYNGETITTDYISTTGVLTNGATVYYCLTTPTDTKITDATLIADLNKILTDGRLKKGTNTISVTSTGTNLPSIIYIKARYEH